MTSRYEAYMDGTSLSSVDSSIYLLDIRPEVPSPQYKKYRMAMMDGMIVRDPYYERSGVNITFEIHKYGIADRMEVCQKVQKWANGSILTTNDRTNQQLHAVCEAFPVANAKNWTEPLTITFGGYRPPFWEDSTATTKTLSPESSVSATIPGNVSESLVSAVVTAAASISSLAFTVGGKTINLSGLSLSSGDEVSLTYNNGILSIKKGNTSLLDKMTGDDYLSVKCGTDQLLYFDASGDASCVYSYRGCWL